MNHHQSNPGQEQEIRIRLSSRWASVPLHVLEDRRVSLAARTVLAYLLHLGTRPGWCTRVRQVQSALGISQGSWQRQRRELQAAGYYKVTRERGERGRIRWIHEVTDQPTIGRGTTDSKTTDGGAIGGNQADIHKNQEFYSSSSGDDATGEFLQCLADLIAAGKGPAAGKEPAYCGRSLGRNVSRAEAKHLMSTARELAANRKFADATAKKQAIERAEKRLKEAEARSRADGDRVLGLNSTEGS